MARGVAKSTEKAEAWLQKNPQAKPADVAKKFGINPSTVYRVRARLSSQPNLDKS